MAINMIAINLIRANINSHGSNICPLLSGHSL